jgi:RNA polymerase sigma-70 factor, ECF subfamily
MSESLRTNDSIQRIIDNYSDLIFRIAFTHSVNRQDAEDVVQNVLIKYLEKHPSFESQAHEKAWIIRVTINMCKEHWHLIWSRRTVELDENIGYFAFNVNEQDEINLFKAIVSLPEKYRTIIYLYYLEKYSTQKISQVAGLKESTVRSQLFRARALLQKSLKEAFNDE